MGLISGLGRSPRESNGNLLLAWRIPWTEEPGGLQSLVSQKSQTWLRWLSTDVQLSKIKSAKQVTFRKIQFLFAFSSTIMSIFLYNLFTSFNLSLHFCYREEANSDSILETVSLTCFYYYNHTQWLAWRTLPLCLTVN